MSKQCTNCGAAIPDNSKFCEFCGKPVEAEKKKQPVCLHCGAPVAKGDAFCTACGTPVEDPVEEETAICTGRNVSCSRGTLKNRQIAGAGNGTGTGK